MKPALAKIDRRTLLIGGGVGVGLVVAFAAWPREPTRLAATRKGEEAFNAFLKIGRDGRVTVAVPQAETGQGIWTALPQLLADELGAAWESVAVEPAPLSGGYANPLADEQGWLSGLGPLRRWRSDGLRITAGSTSVRAFEMPFREAGAAARAMLVAAAAKRWDVPPEDCETVGGFVTHGAQQLGFGEVAEQAARMDPPGDVALREAGTGTLTGSSLPRLDLPAKSDGSFRFAADVRLPGMLYASAWLAPADGRIANFDKQAARAVPGVRAIVDGEGWVAVAAENWWAANEGLKAGAPTIAAPATGDVAELLQQALDGGDARTAFSAGDYDGAVEGSRPLSAYFRAAPAQHLGLEPLSATARVRGGTIEVWAGSQAPEQAKTAAEKASGGARVVFYPMPVGDSGGRAIEADAVPIAVAVASRLGNPVQVTLSASMSHAHGHPAPAVAAEMRALPTPNGALSAWKIRIAGADGLSTSLARLLGSGGDASFGKLDGIAPPYAIPNVAIDAIPTAMPFAAGYVRGDLERIATFFTESFVDEMARIAGIDPLVFRIGMLGHAPRLARCLSTAASLGGWDGGAAGSSMGLAAASAFGSHIGLLAEARVGEGQQVQVHRLVAAVDCGRIANAGLVRQQIEGGLLWALGTARAPAPEFEGGLILPRPFAALGLPRLADKIDIRVELVGSKADPGGISGLGTIVLAPAVANAIAAGSGRRLRSLPIDPRAAS